MSQNYATGAHALVFGASGLAGWGVVDQILEGYPAEGTFSTVTALVNRPLTVGESHWPTTSDSPTRPKLALISGVNLAEGSVDEFTAILRFKVENVENVTHVYYFAYKPDSDDAVAEIKTNREMFERVLYALDRLSPKLEFIVVPSGSKAYGIHISGGVFVAPFKESMGRLPKGTDVHYYAFHDLLAEKSEGKKWTWCDVRPDAIVGFVPNGSAFNLTAHWASYLSTYALVEGQGAKVPFPGTEAAYASLFNEASATMIARFSIWASLHPAETSGQVFNVADQAEPSSMKERWPALCAYFGLEGVGPVNDARALLAPSAYIHQHRHVFDDHGVKSSEVFKGEFLDSYGYYLTMDRHFSLDKDRAVGFSEEIEPNSSWFKAFDRFKKAGMIT